MLHLRNKWIRAGVVSAVLAVWGVCAAAALLFRIDTTVASLKTDVNALADVLQTHQSKLDRLETTVSRIETSMPIKTDVNSLADVLQTHQSKLDHIETTVNRIATITGLL